MLILSKSLKRMPSGRPAPDPAISYDEYDNGISMPGSFDCINKPEYDCKESVPRAGARCSKCTVRTTKCFVIDIHSDCGLVRNKNTNANPIEGAKPVA